VSAVEHESVAEIARAVDRRRVQTAREAGADLVRVTPILSSRSLSELVGGTVALKAENLQRTGSFKLRGALSKTGALGGSAAGVVAGSAGNHAQSLAYAARARGLRCEVYMPEHAPLAKAAATEALGAKVTLGGQTVDECVALARERADADPELAFVSPFDDLDVIAGQATLGQELLDQVDDLAKVVVPLGGGGLLGGTALAIRRHAEASVELVGVQVRASAAFPASLRAGEPVTVDATPTIADGIAIKRPGRLTLPLIQGLVDEVVVVDDDDVADAMVLLMERAKLVVEGAGAVGIAALTTGAVRPAPHGRTVIVLSGGNVDPARLLEIVRRHETHAGRRLRLYSAIRDRPGALAGLLVAVGEAGANVIDVTHVRDGVDLHFGQTGIELVLETRGTTHADAVVENLTDGGYDIDRLE
jgi:threonine dehydratase